MRSVRSGMAVAMALGLSVVPGTGLGASPGTGSTDPDASAAQPWIAYGSDREGVGEGTWLIHPDATGDHLIAADFAGDLILPNWSPDGRRLVLTSRGTGGAEPLYEYDLTSETYQQLFDCEDPCGGDDEPVYSPDGTTVAFIRALGPLTDAGPSDCSLWMGDLASREVRRVTDNDACDREYVPRWSPDGAQLTYWRWREDDGGTTGTAVFVIDADGTDERQLMAPIQCWRRCTAGSHGTSTKSPTTGRRTGGSASGTSPGRRRSRVMAGSACPSRSRSPTLTSPRWSGGGEKPLPRDKSHGTGLC